MIGTVLTGVSGLAVNSTTVFTFDSGFSGIANFHVYGVPKTGGTLAPYLTIATNIPGTIGVTTPYSGASDGFLVWQILQGSQAGAFSDLYSCNPSSPATCASSLLNWFAHFSGQAIACDVGAQKCFEQATSSNALLFSTVTARTPQHFVPELNIASGNLTVSGGFVYAAGPSDPILLFPVLERVQEAGGVPTRLAHPSSIGGPIFVTSGFIYFIAPVAFPAQISFVPFPLGVGDSPPNALPGAGATLGFYADDVAVFWKTQSSQLVTCAPSGCAGSPRVIANGESFADLTSDGQALYWLASTTDPTTGLKTSSSIVKLAR